MDNQNTFAAGPQTVVTPSFTPPNVSTPVQSVPEPRREQTVQQLGSAPTSQPYTLEDLESPSTATVGGGPQNQTQPASGASQNAAAPDPNQAPIKSSLLKRVLITGAIVATIIFLAVLGVVFLSRNRQVPDEASSNVIPDQQIDLSVGQAKGAFDLAIEGQESKLIVNGSVVSRGDVVLTAGNADAYGQISAQNLTGVYSYLLPNATGTFCLDSNNCNYLQETDVTTTTIAGAGGALALGDGLALNGNTIVNTVSFTETAVNNFNGAVTIQGTNNQIAVNNNGGVITLSAPQDLAVISSPTFNSISLTAAGTQNGNVLCDISNNCGYAGGTDAFVHNGNYFGEMAILGTNDAESLAFETNNTVRMTIDTDGNVDIAKSLELGSLASGPDQCSTVLGTIDCRTIFDTGEIYTESTVAVYGVYNIVGLNSAGPNVGGAAGGHDEILLFGNQNYHGTYYGGQSFVVSAATGTVANMVGHAASVHVEAGSATNIYGSLSSVSNNGTVTNMYGSYLEAPVGSGTIQNSYGLYVEDRAGTGTNNSYNIYSAGNGRNLFEGHVGIGNSSSVLMDTATLSVVDTITTAGVGIANAIQVNAGSSGGDNKAIINELNTVGAQNYDSSIGVETTIRHSGTGNIDAAVGLGARIVNEDVGTIALATSLGVASLENTGGGTVLENYGVYIQGQTAGSEDFGVRIDTADTQTLWLAGDETTANSGIAFGSTRDTNLYRSAVGTLKTDGFLEVAQQLQVGANSSFSECSIIIGLTSCRKSFEQSFMSNETTTVTHGAHFATGITPAGATNTQANRSINALLGLYGTQSFSGSNRAIYGQGTSATTSGTVALLGGVFGEVIQSGAGSTLTEAVGVGARVARTAGTLSNAYGMRVLTATGTIGTNYGLHVETQTAGTTDYGIRVDTADTQTLWIAGNAANPTTASAGIAFGSSRDTNLYRGAANRLQTDDSLWVQQSSSTTALNVTTGTDYVFTVDATNGRVGINLGSNNLPSEELEVNGAALFYGSSTAAFTTPLGSNLSAKLAIQNLAVGGDDQVIAVNMSAGSQSNSRGISVFDARGSAHHPSIAVFSPNESDVVGFSWDGSNTTALVKVLTGGLGFATGSNTQATIAAGGATLFKNSTNSTSAFQVQSSGSSTPIFNVDTSNSRVSIGTGTAGYKLDVAENRASSHVANFFNDGNDANRYGIRIQAGADDGSGTTYFVDGYDGDGTQVGYLGMNGGTFQVVNISDVRTKTNINDTQANALDILGQLRVVDFNRAQNPNGPRITGFIAQEVQGIYGQAVSTTSSGLLGVSNDAFIPLLVKGVQQQQGQINAADGRISQLEQQVAALGGEQGAPMAGGFTSINISGSAQVSSLKVTGSATIAGNLTVKGDATFAGNIAVEGHIIGNQDTRGVVTMPAGVTEVKHQFKTPYEDGSMPNIILTATNAFAPSYRVESDKDGFTVYFQDAADAPVKLNYQVQQ